MRTANCPSCGAAVAFRAAASVFAVCEYCRSTLLRKGADFENLGKMAELAEDASLVRLGTEGRYRGVHFVVVGRIQLRHGRGYWNEWHVLYDSQRSGWLGEGYGRTFMTQLKAVREPVPPFSELKVGAAVRLDGKPFTVAGLETAQCVAGEGELPFKVGAGYDVQTADLYGGANFATIDYSETPPFVFIGEQIDPAALGLTHTRDAAAIAAQAEAIKCTGCGAPLTVHTQKIETIACGSCGSVLDAADRSYRILQTISRQSLLQPLLPLGAKGRLHGAEYELIGYMTRGTEAEGVHYGWSEYLLFNPVEGFRWLTEYRGHWNFVKGTRNTPAIEGGAALYLGQAYKHFQTSTAKVESVTGEFYWQVRAEDTNHLVSYIRPPLMLSAESTEKEMVWSISEYTEPDAVAKAFRLRKPLPRPQGVFANQPAPFASARYWGVFLLLAVAALVVQFAISFGGSQRLYAGDFLVPRGGENTLESGMFDLKNNAANLVVRNRTDLANGWAHFNLSLIEADKGTVYRLAREVSYYTGSDWSEGSRDDEAVFARIPAGRYYLTVDAESQAPASMLHSRVEVLRDVPAWLNLWIFLGLMVLAPVIALIRRSTFEVQRWAESDHPIVTTGEGSDDC